MAPPAKNDPEPAAQGPAPAPDSAAAKNAEPAPEVAQQPAPPVAAAPEAAPKPEEKADIEQGKEEKPEEKAHGRVKVTASALRVRAEASFNGAILGKLPRGREVKVIGHEGAWLKIEWDGKPAFIHSKYTTAVSGNEGEEEQGEGESQESHEPKQERPKPTTANANEQQNDHV